MPMYLSRKCPICGFNIGNSPRYERGIKAIAEVLKPVKKELKAAMIKAINHIPSDNRNDRIYYFLKAIKDTDMQIIKNKCNAYLRDDRMVAGAKGLNWLKVVIRDEGINRKKRSYYERKLYGTSPPLLNNKKEKNK